MPNATVDTTKTEHRDLKTLPDGFVELRRMSYMEFLKRRDMMGDMVYRGDGRDAEGVMRMAQEKVAAYEFNTCIVDHNLEYADGSKMDFRTTRPFKELDPRVGEEVSSYIDEMNKWEEDREDPLETSGAEWPDS